MNETANKLTIVGVKRIHGRAELTLSNGEQIVMPRAMLRERPYKAGMPFERSAFEAWMRERAYAFAMDKAVAFLASRSRTEKEVVDALKKSAYSETVVARVMARIHDAGYVNDADFAEQWAASRTSKGLGSRRIRMELRLKGVSQEEIDAALDAVEEEDAFTGALKAAQKAARGKDLSSPADRQKIIAALARRGYDYDMARQAMAELIRTK